MSASRETALANLDKAKLSPRNGKHGPWKKTLEENKQREKYLEKIAEKFDKVLEAHLQLASEPTPETTNERKYLIDQFVGKPVERHEIAQVILKIDV